jgi:phospholipase C
MAMIGSPRPPAAHAAATPIKHVVVIFQENHSFDNVFGAYRAEVSTRAIVRAGLDQPCDGSTKAITIPGAPLLTTMPDIVPQVDHTTTGQAKAIDSGKMDGWLKLSGCQLKQWLAVYRTSQSPNLVTLANRFAMSDRTFESSAAPSWEGHLEIVAATKDGFTGSNPFYVSGHGVPPVGIGWGCDSNKVDGYGPALTLVPSCIPDFSLPKRSFLYGGAFRSTPVAHVPTILDRLDAAGATWKLYAGDGPITSANKDPSGYIWDICPSFAGCLYTRQARNFVANSRVLADATAGTLPTFSVVTPNGNQSQHNGNSWTAGDNWIGKVVSAIENGPDWSSTAIFITWDDCGCFYDHVNPLRFDPSWGLRVPTVIVGPYARAGFTDSTPTTFSGILAYAEHTFGLAPLNSSDGTAYGFANSFNYSQAPIKTPVQMIQMPLPIASVRWIRRHPDPGTDPT